MTQNSGPEDGHDRQSLGNPVLKILGWKFLQSKPRLLYSHLYIIIFVTYQSKKFIANIVLYPVNTKQQSQLRIYRV